MRDMFITPGIDEQKLLAHAREASKEKPDEGVQVHWHSANVLCEAQFEHALFKDGYENSNSSSLERGSGRA